MYKKLILLSIIFILFFNINVFGQTNSDSISYDPLTIILFISFVLNIILFCKKK